MRNRLGSNQYKIKQNNKSLRAVLYIVYLLTIALITNAEITIHSSFKGQLLSPLATRAAYADEITPTPTLNFKDVRAKKLYNFLLSKKSPLASEAQYFVNMADKYALDYTLMPSIAGKESTFGRFVANSFNPFGMTTGKKTGPRFRAFSSWRESIEAEAQLLSSSYRLNANQAIGAKYCPKVECSNTWAEDVTAFANDINN